MMQQQLARQAPPKKDNGTMNLVFKGVMAVAVAAAVYYAYNKYYRQKAPAKKKSEKDGKKEDEEGDGKKEDSPPPAPAAVELESLRMELQAREGVIEALRRTVDGTQEQLSRLTAERANMVNHIEAQEVKLQRLMAKQPKITEVDLDDVEIEEPSVPEPVPEPVEPKKRGGRRKKVDVTEEVLGDKDQ